jgi:hypothetical protein
MSAPFQPGDVVVCVDLSQDRNGNVPETLRVRGKGAPYRVVWVGVNRAGRPILGLFGTPAEPPGDQGYRHWRFRKIDDEVTEEFREQLANLPVRERVS